jgi:hypothetical protein
MLAAFETAGCTPGIRRIQVLVEPTRDRNARPNPAPRLSVATARLLADCAESESDPALRAALIRLSSRT